MDNTSNMRIANLHDNSMLLSNIMFSNFMIIDFVDVELFRALIDKSDLSVSPT